MEENKNLKILTCVLFFVFAAISCWATTESLHMLLPGLPIAFCWAMTIGFFFIASWGTKMITDSLNQNIYMENRGLTLCGGIIIVIVFWLICSMPTNTHTFFFRNLVDQTTNTEINTTQNYLAQIKDGTVTAERIQAKQAEAKNKVDIKLGELKAEIENDANPGFGPKAKEILRDFADLLDVAKIEPLTFIGTSKQDREKLYDAYRQKIYLLLDTKLKNIAESMTPPNDNYRKVAEKDWKNLNILKKSIDDEQLSLTDADDIKLVCDKINNGYSTVKGYQQYVNFNNKEDEAAYTADRPETKVKRLLSVFDVWADFVTGKIGGLSFVFWIIISILVDVAAFICFDIAFKKES